VRVANFHFETVKSAVDMMGAAGVTDHRKMNRNLINKRITLSNVKTYAEIYPYVSNGTMLENSDAIPLRYSEDLETCKETTF
jgi:hypothetical protein